MPAGRSPGGRRRGRISEQTLSNGRRSRALRASSQMPQFPPRSRSRARRRDASPSPTASRLAAALAAKQLSPLPPERALACRPEEAPRRRPGRLSLSDNRARLAVPPDDAVDQAAFLRWVGSAWLGIAAQVGRRSSASSGLEPGSAVWTAMRRRKRGPTGEHLAHPRRQANQGDRGLPPPTQDEDQRDLFRAPPIAKSRPPAARARRCGPRGAACRAGRQERPAGG